MTLLYIVASNFIISLFSFVGVFTLGMREEFLKKILMRLVGLSSGALLAATFFELLPEGLDRLDVTTFAAIMFVSILMFLMIEKFFHWRHCHNGANCEIHSFGYMNLVGDSVHNFIDGLVIASAFSISMSLGITTSLAVALHEIPQEIGDFGVLLHAGFSKRKALWLNFFVGLAAVLGGIIGWILTSHIASITSYLLPIAAGGFLYIALADMIPELRKEQNMKRFSIDFLFILLGVAIMLLGAE